MELLQNIIKWCAENPDTIGLILGSGAAVSVLQWVLNRWMNSKRVIHTSLLLLSTLIGIGDLGVMYSDQVLHLLPGYAGIVFMVALSFYRFGGKTLFTKLEQHFQDAKAGRSLRQPEPLPQLPIEEFAS